MIEPLRSSRLLLEPLLRRHAAVLFRGFNDPTLYLHLPQDPPASVDMLHARYAKLESRCSPDGSEQWLNWAVRKVEGDSGDGDTGDDGYVGLVEATVRPRDRTAIIGYFVFSAFSGRGYGREAVGTMLDFLFAKPEVRKVRAHIDTHNESSANLVRALRFACVETIAEADQFKGRSSDEWVFERLADTQT